ncbi:23S rRNA (uracil(1939)-C(5))-methyltransferase RlmD [Guggenheimella bovis]
MQCKVFTKCGGCFFKHNDYKYQLLDKERAVQQLFPDVKVEPIIGMKEPFFYRNKVHQAFGFERGKTLVGRYMEDTHRIVETDTCLIENETAQRIIETLKDMQRSFKWKVYDENTGVGFLRRVLIRVAEKTNQVLLVIVVTDPMIPGKNNFVKAMTKKHPEITSIVFNVNDRYTSMILGTKEIVAYGKGWIEEELMGLKFQISSKSFFQVNRTMTEVLYDTALKYAGLTKNDIVIDGYSGIGTITLKLAEKAKCVYGVENNKDAVRDAINNAKKNGIQNVQFSAMETGAFLENFEGPVDVVVLDPPRSGLDPLTRSMLLEKKPKRIVYVSCNPETLASDVEELKKSYHVQAVQPVDMFPWTKHVETVVLMSRVDK